MKAPIALLAAAAISITLPADGAEVLFFKLGEQGLATVKAALSGAQAVFDDGYGSRGYTELPMIKITSYARLAKLGTTKEGWLNFGPDKEVYAVSVTWRDAGTTFKTVKDALDTKCGNPVQGGMGFQRNYMY